jgi:hypothetical protein
MLVRQKSAFDIAEISSTNVSGCTKLSADRKAQVLHIFWVPSGELNRDLVSCQERASQVMLGRGVWDVPQDLGDLTFDVTFLLFAHRDPPPVCAATYIPFLSRLESSTRTKNPPHLEVGGPWSSAMCAYKAFLLPGSTWLCVHIILQLCIDVKRGVSPKICTT